MMNSDVILLRKLIRIMKNIERELVVINKKIDNLEGKFDSR